ncbi:response regulator transcription factor [Pseudenhygromyxa sp. WMMC2535]|uniref:response regulator transcription factor n=1 Tax=Pseudenhygromyxa sp. WMMC2535 TaxID=2712867 RepID=UPI0015544728|nr:response regulator [Pseudenhygromyxa sp. WMMC2535]NVB38692.1 response regulator transcription factor [Pseudenhygromyxa sp. WMMC2535]
MDPKVNAGEGGAPSTEESLDGVAILLVEDDPRAAKWVSVALEDQGAKVVWATSIDQAREEIERHEPEIALLDVSLPDGNGLDLIVELRTLPRPCATVVLTGNPESGVARIAAGLGVTEFLAKPVQLDRLFTAVAQARLRAQALRRFCAEYDSSEAPSDIAEGVGKHLGAGGNPELTAAERLARLTAEFGLSARQAQAVAGVAEGLSDADIAKAMKVSYSRTRQLLAAAFAKLGLKSRNDFIRFLWERGGKF